MDLQPVDVFVARQPIFDRDRNVAGYELLYRSSETNGFDGSDPDVASSMNLERTLLGFGLQTVTGGRDAWLNASRGMLVRDHWKLLPTNTVIEVLETITPDPGVIAACHRVRAAGYRLALDDFIDRPDMAPLVAIADFIKVDFRAAPPHKRLELEDRLRRGQARMLAEKIETPEEYRVALGAGYSLFQGYFFCRPEMLRTRDFAPNRISYLRLLREVHSVEFDLDAIEEIIARDVALSVKLLRYIHSASFAWASDVTSIRQALLVIGERPLRQWAALVAVFGLAKGKPMELVVVALMRARFAELLATSTGHPERSLDLFLTGLLSVVDALTDTEMRLALEPIGVGASLRDALLEGTGPLGETLGLVLAWERGQWDDVEARLGRLGLEEPAVARLYADAVLWAEDHAQP